MGSAVVSDDIQIVEHNVENLNDDMRSLAECHPWCMNHRLPAQYRDIFPQPPPPSIVVPAL